MLDLKAEYALLRGEIEPAVLAALAACQYINGPNVKAFEAEAANYAGVKHAIACASGTDALLIALRAIGLGPGDEVITTPFTFVATASTIVMCGATPVFVDIDPHSFNLDLDQVAAAITPRTRAIVPVHLFGQPVHLAPLKALCEQHGLKLIEDAAQSFGAGYGGRKSGAYGDIGCTSFYPSKNLSAFGDGGLMITDNDLLAAELRVLASHGSRVRYHHHVLGYNSRLDEIQAVILRVKLKHLDSFNNRRCAIADLYNQLLDGLVEIALRRCVRSPRLSPVHPALRPPRCDPAGADGCRHRLRRVLPGAAAPAGNVRRHPRRGQAAGGRSGRAALPVAADFADAEGRAGPACCRRDTAGIDLSIHSTAIIAADARLGANVRIGPYAVIEEDVVIGDDCDIAAHAVIKRHTRIGARNRIAEHAVIGGDPQDFKFRAGLPFPYRNR